MDRTRDDTGRSARLGASRVDEERAVPQRRLIGRRRFEPLEAPASGLE